MIYISWFIDLSIQIKEKYKNFTKKYYLENLVLISEEEKKVHINSSVSNVHTFFHACFKGVEFYAAKR